MRLTTITAWVLALALALIATPVMGDNPDQVTVDENGHASIGSAVADGVGFQSALTTTVYSVDVALSRFSPQNFLSLPPLDDAAVAKARASNSKGGFYQISLANNPSEPIAIGLDSADMGEWTTTAKGDRVYHLKVYADGAKAQRAYFSKFDVAAGVEARVYNMADPNEAYGPYTGSGLGNKKFLLAHPIIADTTVVEIFVPAKLVNSGRDIQFDVVFDGVLHYFEDYYKLAESVGTQQIPDRQPRFCVIDSTCYPTWESWEEGIMRLEIPSAGGAACTIGGSGLCTGNLLNNNARRYFVLTAYHCIGGPCQDVSAAATLFTFQYESTICEVPPAEFPGIPLTNIYPTNLGAEDLAASPDNGTGNDMFLMEMFDPPPSGTRYLPWTTKPMDDLDEVINISHPEGSYKSICFGHLSAIQLLLPDMFWTTTMAKGAPFGGSSGSALLNNDGEIVGQLLGGGFGDGGCEGGEDYWGRFDVTYPEIRQFLINNDDDSYEHNDTIDDAREIGEGCLSLKSRDDDWFFVVVPDGQGLTVELDYNSDLVGDPDAGVDPGLDLALSLIQVDEDDVETVIAAQDNTPPLGNEMVEIENETGTPQVYFILVEYVDGTQSTPYEMCLTFTIVGDDRYEENDNATIAANLDADIANSLDGDDPGLIDNLFLQDPDWYLVTVPAGQAMRVTMNYQVLGADVFLRFYDPSLNLLGQAPTEVDRRVLEFENTTAAPVPVLVEVTSVFFNPAGPLTYELLIEFLNVDDIFEDNDTLATASPIAFGQYPLTLRDDDYFLVSIPPQTQLVANIDFDPTISDIDVDLYDTGGGLLAQSFNTGGFESVTYVNTSDATLSAIVRVFNFDPTDNFNTYNMQLFLLPAGNLASRTNWYFAAGSTKSTHNTYLTLLNETDENSLIQAAADVQVTMFFDDGTAPLTMTQLVQPGSRATVNFFKELQRAGLAEKNFGLFVVSRNSVNVSVERSVYWDALGVYRIDGFVGGGARGIGKQWFLAEGTTTGDRETHVQILNPIKQSVKLRVEFLVEDDANVEQIYTLAAESQMTLETETILPNTNFSVRVTVINDHPGVVVERTMYGGADGVEKIWGHHTMGCSDLKEVWYLAEGATHSTFETFIPVANPNDQDVIVDFTFYPTDGKPVVYSTTIPGNSRFTLDVARDVWELANSGGFSVKVSSRGGYNIVVERTMYWSLPGATFRTGGSNTAAATETSLKWRLAEGATGGGSNFESFVLLNNPSTGDASVRVTFHLTDGSDYFTDVVVGANSRVTVKANDVIPQDGATRSAAATIESTNGVPIVVERAMYWGGLLQAAPAGVNRYALPGRIGGHVVGGIAVDE